jgi:hypothetical protein
MEVWGGASNARWTNLYQTPQLAAAFTKTSTLLHASRCLGVELGRILHGSSYGAEMVSDLPA